MRLKLSVIFILFIAFSLFFSFMQSNKIIVDMAKNTVKLPEKIERVITLDPFSTQIMIGLGLKDLLVDAQYGTNLIGDGFIRIIPELKSWGSSFSRNNVILENLIEKKPDLIISQIGRPDINKIMDLKIPLIQIEVENDQAFIGSLNFIAEIFNKKQRAAEISKFVSIKLNEFYSANDKNKNKVKPKVYVAGSNILRTFGSSSFQKWLVNLAGGIFATESYSQFKVDINPETLIKLNPDYIILSKYTSENVDQIKNDPRFSKINAVKNGNIYRIPSFILSWDLPSFEMIAGISYLRYILGFNTILEFNDTIKNLYKIIYDLELNDEDISKFLIKE